MKQKSYRVYEVKNPKAGAFGFMAEAEGFEPPWAFTPKLFSRQPRYDRFDMPPYRRNMKLVFTPKKCDFRNALEKSNAGKKNPRKSVMPYRILEDEANKQDKISRQPRYDRFDMPPSKNMKL